jgi:hypothetical protein
MRQAIEFIHAGKIGTVRVAHALCYKRRKSIGLVDTPAPLPAGIDFDLWAGPAPAVIPNRERLHYDWHWDQLTGNGDLGNQNPHEIDKARWGLGKHTLPTEVVSLGGRLGYQDNGDTANSQISLFKWDDALVISEVRGLELKTKPTIARQAGPVGVANIWWGTEGYVVPTNCTTITFSLPSAVVTGPCCISTSRRGTCPVPWPIWETFHGGWASRRASAPGRDSQPTSSMLLRPLPLSKRIFVTTR